MNTSLLYSKVENIIKLMQRKAKGRGGGKTHDVIVYKDDKPTLIVRSLR
jgi:hypothetical protein